MRTFVACLALSFVAPAFSAEDSFPRTDARTWSREGAFKVRWGMGPGDVKSIYPSLGQNRFFYSTVDFVEGMDVLVLFWVLPEPPVQNRSHLQSEDAP